MPDSFVDLLIENYLEWQKRCGAVKTIRDFSSFLDVHEVTINRLINGRRPPTPKMLVHLATKLNDPRFYDIGKLPHPDPVLTYIASHWESLPPEARHALQEQAERYVTENERRSKEHAEGQITKSTA